MSLDAKDYKWLDGKFGEMVSATDNLKNEFSQHRVEDTERENRQNLTASALQAHIEHCNGSKLRKKRTWRFWIGVIVAIAAPIIAVIAEHWFFVAKVSEQLKR